MSSKTFIELWADFDYRDSFPSQVNFNAGHIWNNSMTDQNRRQNYIS